ncbi:tagaturonate reductase [Spirochaeta cellobiosiphila]|uniref:tagaturonate reductase n=1 Tax=Spirochaeta cellobiosiphila TaxID=504483 RepID=UPI000418D574|nr:tagaturonate reductase [Spirochaeta cellobiosiphila]
MSQQNVDLLPVRDWAANNQKKPANPVKILQFGEGNFLRAFVDWMIDILNEKSDFNGSVRIVQPLDRGMVSMLNDQDGLYTVVRRGLSKGQIVQDNRLITSIEKGINPYTEYDEFLASATLEELRFIVSNTTEAGIRYEASDKLEDKPASSFPGKVTQLLWARFNHFKGDKNKGINFIPCELIDKNGDNLKAIVLRLAKEWNLTSEFINWVEDCNVFTNTLVDRIVPGYPANEIDELCHKFGYKDNLAVSCEDFHLWVIEGGEAFQKELPLTEVGLNVVWTDDLPSYRTRKVRILNGIHTMTCAAAYQYGIETVKESFDDDVVSKFISLGLEKDILPTLADLKEDPAPYAQDVLERFANPFIQHAWLSISLNTVSKFKTRVLPSLLGILEGENKVPEVLAFALASIVAFYEAEKVDSQYFGEGINGRYEIKDTPANIDYIMECWKAFDGDPETMDLVVEKVLKNEDFWGQDLSRFSNLSKSVSLYLFQIKTRGMKKAMADLVSALQ